MRVSEMWQADFTYFRIVGWGWCYLSAVLDDPPWELESARRDFPAYDDNERYLSG